MRLSRLLPAALGALAVPAAVLMLPFPPSAATQAKAIMEAKTEATIGISSEPTATFPFTMPPTVVTTAATTPAPTVVPPFSVSSQVSPTRITVSGGSPRTTPTTTASYTRDTSTATTTATTSEFDSTDSSFFTSGYTSGTPPTLSAIFTAVAEILASVSTFVPTPSSINVNVSEELLLTHNLSTTEEPFESDYDQGINNTFAATANNSGGLSATTMNVINNTAINTGDEYGAGPQYRLGTVDSGLNVSQALAGAGSGLNDTEGSMDIAGRPQRFDPRCLLFDFLIEAVFMGILCLLGFTGNTLSMICLWRDKSKTATPFLLVSLELADTLFLVTVLLLRVLTSIHDFTGWLSSMMAVFPHVGAYVYACALIAETGSIYLTILVTVNRYVSVCRPYEASDLCSIYHARRHVVLVAAFSVLFNLPRFFEYSVAYVVNPATNQTVARAMMTEFARSMAYQIIYANALYFLVMFALPLLTLVCLNYKLIRALRRTKKKRAQLISSSHVDSQSRSEDDITLVLIVVVIVFILSQTPALVTQSLLSFLQPSRRICPNAFFFYERISDLMVVANASMNFIIYCFCSTKFRQILVNLLCKKELDSPEQSDITKTSKVPKVAKVTKVRTTARYNRSAMDSMV